MISTKLTPDNIIGEDNIDLFKLHFTRTYRCNSKEEHDRALKEMGLSQHVIDSIAEMYSALRENGYIPFGLDQYGNVKFGSVTKSEIQMLVEKDTHMML